MPRLNVEISEELDQELDRFLPWGTRSEIVRILLRQLVGVYQKEGFGAIDSIMSNRRTLYEFKEGVHQ